MMGKERLLQVLCLGVLCTVPGEASVRKILDKIAEIGYEIISEFDFPLSYPISPVYGPPVHGPYGPYAYGPPAHDGYKEDVHIPVDPGLLWNGHIPVGDFVSPIAQALGAAHGSYSNRVVKGYENRLGLRIALPYLGDFQVTRELGPGRFLDKLGPGKFPYPGLKGVQGSGHKHHPESSEHHHGAHKPDMYKGLQNYPWHRR